MRKLRSNTPKTREKEDDKVFVVLNLSEEARLVEFLGGDYADSYTELFSEGAMDIDQDFSLQMMPWEYKVYYR